jgi:hypothetical protein
MVLTEIFSGIETSHETMLFFACAFNFGHQSDGQNYASFPSRPFGES